MRSITQNKRGPMGPVAADIAQVGGVETEFGWSRSWQPQGGRETNLGNLLKYSVLCDLEIRWNSTIVTSQSILHNSQYGTGDNLIGAQWRAPHMRQTVAT